MIESSDIKAYPSSYHLPFSGSVVSFSQTRRVTGWLAASLYRYGMCLQLFTEKLSVSVLRHRPAGK